MDHGQVVEVIHGTLYESFGTSSLYDIPPKPCDSLWPYTLYETRCMYNYDLCTQAWYLV